jgi:outer membrane protein OmpA-like peptidoglycan-associated protein
MTKNAKYYLLMPIVFLFLLGACVEPNVNPGNISLTTNPVDATDTFADDLFYAKNQRLDVLAPQNFAKAVEILAQAQAGRKNGLTGEQILLLVSKGRAYLDRASDIAARSSRVMAKVLKARDLAIQAGADQCGTQLASLDSQFKVDSYKVEDRIPLEDGALSSLQLNYQELEKNSVVKSQLNETKDILAKAEKKNSKVAKTKDYKEAQDKLNQARAMISSDCRGHVQTTAVQASRDSLQAAQHVFKLADSSGKVKKPTRAQQISSDIEKRLKESADPEADSSAIPVDSERSVASTEPITGGEIGAIVAQTDPKQKKERLHVGLEKARAELAKEEADVYVQGNSLVIRLKAINFPPGKAELPPDAIESLSKVKDVLQQMKGDKFIVEGHTDNVGNNQTNKILSQGRAEAVSEYFVSSKSAEPYQVNSIGYGDEQPIADNKTEEGRSLNRRVDIIIKETK